MSNQQHEQICKDLHMTYLMKNADYGDSFKESLDKHGLIAAVVRMSDKLNRLDSLKDKAGQVGDEKLSDTVLDLANYAIMTAMWIEDSGRRTEQLDLFRVGEQIDYRGGLVKPIEVEEDFDGDYPSLGVNATIDYRGRLIDWRIN